MKVAIQGQAWSFHDTVARRWFDDAYEMVPCTTFTEVFNAFEQDEAEAIVVAVENTTYGSINQVYQLIEECSAPIVGEYKLPISLQLVADTGASLDTIREVYSHPVALAQCRQFLDTYLPQAVVIEHFDTAGAVEYVAAQKSPSIAAVGSQEAATAHGLSLLHTDIHDNPHNITRFLILGQTEAPGKKDRTSLVITTNHQPGALVDVLQQFAAAGINLAKLQSQPIIGKSWQYKFFIDVDAAGATLHQVLDAIRISDHTVKVLGEYQRFKSQS